MTNIQNATNKAKAESITIASNEYRELEKQKAQNNQAKQDLKDEIKLQNAAKDSLIAKEIELKRLQESYRRVSAEVAKSMLPQIQKLDTEVKKLEADMGRHGRNVGNYRSGFNGL